LPTSAQHPNVMQFSPCLAQRFFSPRASQVQDPLATFFVVAGVQFFIHDAHVEFLAKHWYPKSRQHFDAEQSSSPASEHSIFILSAICFLFASTFDANATKPTISISGASTLTCVRNAPAAASAKSAVAASDATTRRVRDARHQAFPDSKEPSDQSPSARTKRSTVSAGMVWVRHNQEDHKRD